MAGTGELGWRSVGWLCAGAGGARGPLRLHRTDRMRSAACASHAPRRSCADSTCDDGVQNGDEDGVDCGGSCAACGVCPPPRRCSVVPPEGAL